MGDGSGRPIRSKSDGSQRAGGASGGTAPSRSVPEIAAGTATAGGAAATGTAGGAAGTGTAGGAAGTGTAGGAAGTATAGGAAGTASASWDGIGPTVARPIARPATARAAAGGPE